MFNVSIHVLLCHLKSRNWLCYKIFDDYRYIGTNNRILWDFLREMLLFYTQLGLNGVKNA